ncbi:MAG: hypothetical protein WBB28_15780, partial [Crinalium sp.]
TIIGSYLVPIKVLEAGMQTAVLAPATKDDMPTDWSCSWIDLWNQADFDCEAIIKLSYQKQTLGLIKFGLYPYLGNDLREPEYLEILNIEAAPKSARTVNPVGFWLIWYAVDIALKVCSGESDGTLIRLDAFEDKISYYRDKVKMDSVGCTTIAPGEEGYAFRFTRQGAEEFYERQTSVYGSPTRTF